MREDRVGLEMTPSRSDTSPRAMGSVASIFGFRDSEVDSRVSSPGTPDYGFKSRTLYEIATEDGSRGFVRALVRTPAFDWLVCMVVVANSAAIGLEQKVRLERNDMAFFRYLELAFLLFYIVELALHFYGFGLACLLSNWTRFDLVLVICGIASQAMDFISGSGQGNPVGSLVVLRIARLLRLARLVRTLKVVIGFKDVWMLARGLMNAVSTAFHTLVVGFILLYVIGCVIIEFLPLAMMESQEPVNEDVQRIVESNFRSLPQTLLTLVSFMTLDNASLIYKPLIEADATLALVFVPVLLLAGVVYMNLVTAIIVNSGLQEASKDRHMTKEVCKAKSKRLIAELQEAFVMADTNCSGTISRRELYGIDLEGKHFLQEMLGVTDLAEIFDCLDVDHQGEIGIEDFCNSIDQIVVTEIPLVVMRMERMMDSMRRMLYDPPAKPSHRLKTRNNTLAPRMDKVPLPPWADRLIDELKEAYSSEMRTLTSACSMAAQASARKRSEATPARAVEPADEPADDVVAVAGWEVLPPVLEQRIVEGRPSPAHSRATSPAGSTGAAGAARRGREGAPSAPPWQLAAPRGAEDRGESPPRRPSQQAEPDVLSPSEPGLAPLGPSADGLGADEEDSWASTHRTDAATLHRQVATQI